MTPERVYELMVEAGYPAPHLSNRAHHLVRLILEDKLEVPKAVQRPPQQEYWVLFSDRAGFLWSNLPTEIEYLKQNRIFETKEARDAAEEYIVNLLK